MKLAYRNTGIGVLCFLTSFPAFAGIMFEPYAGYETGTINCTSLSGISCDHNITGTAYGLRLGWRFPTPIWFALEGSSGSDTGKYGTAGVADEKISHTQAGLAIGFDFYKLRFWAGFSSSFSLTEVDQANPKSTPDRSHTGTSAKAGIGFSPFRLISLNVEYIQDSVSKVSLEGDETSYSMTDQYRSYSPSRILVSLSFPYYLNFK